MLHAKTVKIVEVSSQNSDSTSTWINQEIVDYCKMKAEKGEANQFAAEFCLLENESVGRLVFKLNQVCHIDLLWRVHSILLQTDAQELHYYFPKNEQLFKQ